MNVHKTLIHKMYGKWRVSYYLPYSGFLYMDYDSWVEALEAACLIEETRVYM